MADATDSKSVARKGVRVRVPPRAPRSEPGPYRHRWHGVSEGVSEGVSDDAITVGLADLHEMHADTIRRMLALIADYDRHEACVGTAP